MMMMMIIIVTEEAQPQGRLGAVPVHERGVEAVVMVVEQQCPLLKGSLAVPVHGRGVKEEEEEEEEPLVVLPHLLAMAMITVVLVVVVVVAKSHTMIRPSPLEMEDSSTNHRPPRRHPCREEAVDEAV